MYRSPNLDEATERLLRLLDEHGPGLHALLVKLTLRKDAAEDLLQDLFIRMSESKGFRLSPTPERYLFRAAVNLAFDWRKQMRRSSAASQAQLIDEDIAEWDSPVEKAIRQEELERVLVAMERLPERHRELIALRYLHGWSYDELAMNLNSTPHRVRALCSKTVARLRKLIHADTAKDQL